ncbi:YncE family protein [Hyunsoonleella sp. SJ7]|uniref:YncE family protein n=1 Tax=Hyunsoonleella aquatilis TaxID=2762758 RepID=A0A923KI07_9FLAO|nr:DUF5074 domain-containing protein [Hyunsoonleella aquatilis]MBC3757689.1 YncE family protein [Hyunsoonleella aquatilis]
MKLNKLLVLALSIGLFFTSCSTDDDTIIIPKGDYENGILISHEGNFGMGNASVSFVSFDLNTVENDVFNNVNNKLLGDTAQSIAFNGDLAYIVLNVSNKIEIVNRYTFESVSTIDSGLSNPRYMAISNGKGYVTNWGDFTPSDDDFLAVIDLTSNSIIDTINTSYLPEEIVAQGNKVYVATGIFGNGNKVDVINTETDEFEESITVGNSPNSLQLDDDGDLWVLSSENLIEIATSTNQISRTIALNAAITSPSKLNFDNGALYLYSGGSVYKMEETASTLPSVAEIESVSFYDMRVKDGVLYALDAKDFVSDGSLTSYDLSTNTEVNSATVNIIPGGIYFN